MVPDSLLLRLHSHGHTLHVPHEDQNQAHIDKKHTHCAVEDVFHAPFQPSLERITFARPTFTAIYTTGYYASWQAILSIPFDLRGPPVA
nr:hypothetical protein [Pontibacter ruber]